jgi:hypothetical protein
MLVAWAGMGVGGYAGGLMFDAFADYTLSFVLAGAAGGLNLVAILALAVVRRRAAARPRHVFRRGDAMQA